MTKLVLFLCLIGLAKCSTCGDDVSHSKVVGRETYLAKDSLGKKIRLPETLDSLSYEKIVLVWSPSITYAMVNQKNHFINEFIPMAYACSPAEFSLDSLHSITIKSTQTWNTAYQADTSLNEIFNITTFANSSLLSTNQYKHIIADYNLYFNTFIPPDSNRIHRFIIDVTLTNGNRYIDTLNSIIVTK